MADIGLVQMSQAMENIKLDCNKRTRKKKEQEKIVVFWNTQRTGKAGTDKFKFVVNQHMESWIQSQSPPDVLILGEITQNGEDLQNYIKNNDPWKRLEYNAEFMKVSAKNNKVSPCSFLVAHKGHAEIKGRGQSTKRPYIEVLTDGIVIGGCHIIATGGDPSAEEITDMITDLTSGSSSLPVVLIGDMNFPFDKSFPDGEEQQINQMKWTKISPGFSTFKKKNGEGTIIDYIWTDDTINKCKPIQLIPSYSHWEIVDHAPIAYKIKYETLSNEDET
ncbi:hypothetical protein [Scytonema sp. PRP1]|uniref:hypothetical protein n=1 Tax=Scytonema sp. PRP1 TaxID=3120513 RepID=UPI002FD0B971